MADVLIQTRIPAATAKWIAEKAQRAGLSVAAWLRNHLIEEKAKMLISAWPVAKGATNAPFADAELFLEPSRNFSATERAFWVYFGPGSDDPGAPAPPDLLRKYAPDSEIFLKGGIRPCAIIAATFDETSQRLEVTLRHPPA